MLVMAVLEGLFIRRRIVNVKNVTLINVSARETSSILQAL
jgi:hypothetical protein